MPVPHDDHLSDTDTRHRRGRTVHGVFQEAGGWCGPGAAGSAPTRCWRISGTRSYPSQGKISFNDQLAPKKTLVGTVPIYRQSRRGHRPATVRSNR